MKKICIFSVALLWGAFLSRAQEVIELPMPELNKVVVKIAFRNGSICDPSGKEGLTNLTAQLITETGSDQYTKSQIDDLLFPMAARYSAFSDKEMTTFTFQVHVDKVEEFYDIFRGLLLRPSFAEPDFERVRSNLEGYISQVIKASSDEDYSKLALESQLFRGTRYQHPKAGTIEGLAAITLADVREHYRRFFTRHNVRLGIAGNYDETLLDRIKSDLQELPDVHPEIPQPAPPQMPDGIRVELIPKPENRGTAIYGGYPLSIDRGSGDWPAMMVVNSYLGEHRKSYSKLYQLIREQRSMNYGDYTYTEWYEAGGQNQLPLTGFPRSHNYFAIWIRPVQTAYSLRSQYPELADVEIGHAHFALRMALYEIDRVRREGLSQEEFELTRQFLRSYIKLFIQTPERRLGFLMDSPFYGLEDYISEMDQKLASLTLEEVNAAAAKYLQTNNLYITMITDQEEVEPLRQSLLQNKPSPMAYANVVKESLEPEIFELDTIVEKLPLNVKSVEIVPSKELFRTGREGG